MVRRRPRKRVRRKMETSLRWVLTEDRIHLSLMLIFTVHLSSRRKPRNILHSDKKFCHMTVYYRVFFNWSYPKNHKFFLVTKF